MQREVDAARHLLACELCASLSQSLMERGQRSDNEARIPIHGDPDIVREALNTGARGYVVKSRAARDLLPAIAVVLANGTFVSDHLDRP